MIRLDESKPIFNAPQVNDSDFDEFEAPKKKKTKCCVLILVLCFIVVAVFGFGLIIGRYAIHNGKVDYAKEICANPPLLLVSMDGFWEGYFSRGLNPVLQNIANDGVRAKFMESTFPTKTFPNHFSIVTGLYPESHGIVDNKFFDKKLNETFYISSPDVNDEKWWLGEPIWVTAAKNGLKTGVYFWPGSEVSYNGIMPDFYFNYNSSVPFAERVDTVLSWYDLPSNRRPQFAAMYMNQPDHSGHTGGPNSSLVDAALGFVDEAIETLFYGLRKRGILDCVNVMLVSDHGMASFQESKLTYLEDILQADILSSIQVVSYGVNLQINTPKDELMAVYDALSGYAPPPNATFDVFLRQDIPTRLHAGNYNTQRYGDIFVMGKLGSYTLRQKGSKPRIKGMHGYDNQAVEMQAIFIARGPAFKTDYVAPSFSNIELYNLMCDLLKINHSQNNGTEGYLNELLKTY